MVRRTINYTIALVVVWVTLLGNLLPYKSGMLAAGQQRARPPATKPALTDLELNTIDGRPVTYLQAIKEAETPDPPPMRVRSIADMTGLARGVPPDARLWMATRPKGISSWIIRGPYLLSARWALRDVPLSDPRVTVDRKTQEIVFILSKELKQAGLITEETLAKKSLKRSKRVRVVVMDQEPMTGPCRVVMEAIGGLPARRAKPIRVTREETVRGKVYNIPAGAYVGLAVRPLDSLHYWIMEGTEVQGTDGSWSQTAYFGRDPNAFNGQRETAYEELDEHKRFRLIAFVTRDRSFPYKKVDQKAWHDAFVEGKFLAIQEVETVREFDINVAVSHVNGESLDGAEHALPDKPIASVWMEVDRPLPPGYSLMLLVRAVYPRTTDWHIVAENQQPGNLLTSYINLARDMGIPDQPLELQAFVRFHASGKAPKPVTYRVKPPSQNGRTNREAVDWITGLPSVSNEKWGELRSASLRVRVTIQSPEE